jgi:glycosyltransferase involved in cell wall biosynthesis
MSYGVPVISTKIGAEGIDCTPNENILIADTKLEFENKIMYLWNDYSLYDKIRINANKLVKDKYDWSFLGCMLNSNVKQVLNTL